MASDGVWEFITSQVIYFVIVILLIILNGFHFQEAIDIVSSKIDKGVHIACQELIEMATQRWQEEEGDYRDDVSRF